MSVFMIRGQGSGFRTDKVFLRPPTKDELAKALQEELLRHGFTSAGKPKKLWVRVETVEAVGAAKDMGTVPAEDALLVEGILTQEQVDTLELVDKTERTMVEGEASQIEMTGEGTVTAPDDPAHPRNQL